jgi:hypothetical protein
MDSQWLIARLGRNAPLIRGLVEGITPEQAPWKPEPQAWSILEVVNHLYDEEREDFRTRLDLVLQDPERDWPPIDPQGWVAKRSYNTRGLEESLNNFLAERERSLAWLEGLRDADWEKARVHPIAGSLRAGDLLASWVAHDFLHARQLARLHLQYAARQAVPYDGSYAGSW